MAPFGAQSNLGLDCVIVALAGQLILLALSLTQDEEGLFWVRREDECDDGNTETQYYWRRLCVRIEEGERTCSNYDEVEGQFIDDAKNDMDRAGRLAAGALALTTVMLWMTFLARVYADDIAEFFCCKRMEWPYKAVMVVLTVITIVFTLGAASVVAESRIVKNSDDVVPGLNCTHDEDEYGFGHIVMVAVAFWSAALLGFFICPCGAFEYAEPHPGNKTTPTDVEVAEGEGKT